jgi:hypothetical protein
MVAVLTANFHLGNHSVLRFKAPVIRITGGNTKIIGSVLILCNKFGIGKEKVSLQHISILQQMPGQQSRRNIVCLVIEGILDKLNVGILIQKLVELFTQITADNDNLLNTCGNNSIQK